GNSAAGTPGSCSSRWATGACGPCGPRPPGAPSPRWPAAATAWWSRTSTDPRSLRDATVPTRGRPAGPVRPRRVRGRALPGPRHGDTRRWHAGDPGTRRLRAYGRRKAGHGPRRDRSRRPVRVEHQQARRRGSAGEVPGAAQPPGTVRRAGRAEEAAVRHQVPEVRDVRAGMRGEGRAERVPDQGGPAEEEVTPAEPTAPVAPRVGVAPLAAIRGSYNGNPESP